MAGFDALSILSSLSPGLAPMAARMATGFIPPGIPGGDILATAIQGAGNALATSPEAESRFAKLMAGWTASELQITAIPDDGSVSGAKDILPAYRQWVAYRDAWLQGQKDANGLTAQEDALKRVSAMLTKQAAQAAQNTAKAAASYRPRLQFPADMARKSGHSGFLKKHVWVAGAVMAAVTVGIIAIVESR